MKACVFVDDKPDTNNECFLFNEIDKITDAECVELVALSVIDKFHADEFNAVMQKLTSKIRLNGQLIISGLNFNAIIRSVKSGDLETVDASRVLSPLRSFHNMEDILLFLQHKKFKIVSKVMDGLNYIITGQRYE